MTKLKRGCVGLLALLAGSSLFCRPAFADDQVIRIRTSEAPLLVSPEYDGQVIRKAVEGEKFIAVTEVDAFYLVRDEASESFLYVPRELAYKTFEEPPVTIYVSGRMPSAQPEDLSQWQVSPTNAKYESQKLRTSPDGMLVAHNGKKYPATYEYQMDYMPQVDGQLLVNDALKFRGVSYVLGGEGMKGIDCSGLVKTCLARQGIDLVHRSSLQALEGRYISHTNLEPGDLIYFRDDQDSRYLSHVGIYIGRGRFVHASQSAGGVVVTSLSDKYFKSHYAFARRM